MNECNFGEIEIGLSGMHQFCDIRVPFFLIAQRFETEVIAQRLETEVSECGVLLDNECRSLHSPRAQISQVDVDANCECKSMRSVYSEKNLFGYGLVALLAQRFVSE